MSDHIFLAVSGKGIHRAEQKDEGVWQVETHLADRGMTCLASDPSRPQNLFAGCRNGVLRSDDGGNRWVESGMTGHIIKSLAISPLDPNRVYAGTKPAHLFRSDDGGRTWRELEGFRKIPNRWWWFSPAEPPDFRPYVMSIAPSPTERDVLLAGIELGAVVRSTDGGETWSRHRTGALRDCHSLKFHATDRTRLYQAGGTGAGAAFSLDGGATFHQMKQGLAVSYGIACAADPVTADCWYVCVAPGPFNAFGSQPTVYLYRSEGKGGWTPIGWHPHPLPATPTALVTVPGMPGTLVAGLHTGEIRCSSDYGDHWERLPFTMPDIWFGLVVLPSVTYESD
jgi:photosystem II stability/assembly factor-like uncharacterized protein